VHTFRWRVAVCACSACDIAQRTSGHHPRPAKIGTPCLVGRVRGHPLLSLLHCPPACHAHSAPLSVVLSAVEPDHAAAPLKASPGGPNTRTSASDIGTDRRVATHRAQQSLATRPPRCRILRRRRRFQQSFTTIHQARRKRESPLE